MTLTICIIAKDGVVFASDSKASAFLTSNETVKKIFRLDDNNAVGIAGDGELAMHFFDLISLELDFKKGISNLAEQIRALGKAKFEESFSHLSPKDRPGLVILLAGYTIQSESKPAIYELSSEDNFIPRKSATGFNCIGIPVIADYLLNRLYEKDITTIKAIEMATFCIKETASQDSRVGGPTQISTFSNIKQYAELSKAEIEKIEKRCELLRSTQKNYFYPENINSGFKSPKDATKKPPREF